MKGVDRFCSDKCDGVKHSWVTMALLVLSTHIAIRPFYMLHSVCLSYAADKFVGKNNSILKPTV